MIRRSKKTCIWKTFSSSVSALERHLRELVEVRVALGDATGLVRELQPRLGVAGPSCTIVV